MPIDPVKLQQVLDRGDQLTKRFDAFAARRAKADSDRLQRKADKAKRKADQSRDPDWLDIEPFEAPAWFDDSHLESEREELRQGNLSRRGP